MIEYYSSIFVHSYEHKKNDSISSNCSSKSLYGLSDDGLHSPNNSLDKQVKINTSVIWH